MKLKGPAGDADRNPRSHSSDNNRPFTASSFPSPSKAQIVIGLGMERSIDPEDLLLSAFIERNIPYKRDQIRSALSGCDHAWLSEHLSHDTFLTRDEFTLYIYHFIDISQPTSD